MDGKQELIPEVEFAPRTKQGFEFEIMPLRSLFEKELRENLEAFHRLEFNALLLATGGEGVHYIDFEKIIYREGTALFVAQGQVHHFVVNETASAYVLLFTNRFLYQSESDLKVLKNYSILNPALGTPSVELREDTKQALYPLCQFLLSEYNSASTNLFREEIMRSTLRTILSLIEREKRSDTEIAVRANYAEFLKFEEKVDALFHKTRNVEDYARALKTTTRKLNEITSSTIGKNAKEFIDQRVTLESMRLLAYTRLPTFWLSH